MSENKKLRSGQFNVDVEEKPLLWKDRKRWLGMPLSFTVYMLNEDKLMINTGLLNLHEEEILLYRVRDISVKQSLGERIFGVGTVCINSSDATLPHVDLLHVKNARKVKEVIGKCVEDSRRRNGIRSTELMGGTDGHDGPPDLDGDGIPDLPPELNDAPEFADPETHE